MNKKRAFSFILLLPLLIISGHIGTIFIAVAIVTLAPYLNIPLQLGLYVVTI